jgi:3D-(3,5/4)-trihydroxycyclohexane-1,2-dione acylhydrolase (decyclizing)
MARLTTGQAVVRFLASQYCERDGASERLIPAMLGIFGHGNVAGLGEALATETSRLPFIQGRNEQGLVHIASSFARERRRLSTLAVTTSIGPGATNLVTGAASATINRLPVLLLPADTYAGRQQGNVLQQLEHAGERDVSVNDCLRPVSRFFDRITRPGQLVDSLPEAMRVLTSPVETGAVTIALPQDVQTEAAEFPDGMFGERHWHVDRAAPSREAIEEAARWIAAAERPLLIAGGGVFYSAAESALEELSALCGIPVAETFAGKGSLGTDSWRLLGGLGVEGTPAANEIAAHADLVIAVGTRLGDFVTASRTVFQERGVRFVGVNVDGRDAAKLGALPVLADAHAALSALTSACSELGVKPSPSYQETVTERGARWREQRGIALSSRPRGTLTSGEVIGALNEAAADGDVIITAAGAPPGDLLKVWDATGGRRCHIEFGYSCMGYEIPAGIGARLARTDGQVVVLVGDGSFVISPGELSTAVQEHLRVVIVVLDNHGFQVIRRLQVSRGGTSFGNEFVMRSGQLDLAHGGGGAGYSATFVRHDLVSVARGLGAEAYHVTDTADLLTALAKARSATSPFVIVAEIDPYSDLPPSGVWWDVAPAEVSATPGVEALRDAYQTDRARLQRQYGVD